MRTMPRIGTTAVAACALAAGLALCAPGKAASAASPRAVAQADSPAQPASPLPGGASSLNETYKDWNVVCVQQGAGKRCVLSQTRTQQNGQRVLAVELNPPAGNSISGVLLLPLGLALDAGVTLQIDDKPATQPLRFRTCVPAGCVVPLSFDAATVAALRTGTVVKLRAAADGGKEALFSISLQGFPNALDRLVALAR